MSERDASKEGNHNEMGELKMKTVGDLIKALQKYDKRILLARRTNGYFQCIVPVEYFVISKEKLNLTTVKDSKIVKDKRKRKQNFLFVEF